MTEAVTFASWPQPRYVSEKSDDIIVLPHALGFAFSFDYTQHNWSATKLEDYVDI